MVECVLKTKALIGESPVWCPDEELLYWVDIAKPAIHQFNPLIGTDRYWKMPATVGSIGLCEQSGAIVALRTGLFLFNFETETLRYLGNPEAHLPMTRFNDGKVSPEGRFWVGSMDDRENKQPLGALYRLDPDLTWQRSYVTGLRCSNGLAWSPDGCIMYHSDSRIGTIHCYDYDLETGKISKQRIFAKQNKRSGKPDGAATDMDGNYWSAGVTTGTLNCWSPDGQLIKQIEMPCTAPTMPCFGGSDMKTLYVTSLTKGQPADKLAEKPLSGGLFALQVDVAGVPVAKFKGGL
jgi:sugar lactone lactonase YvrE